MQYKAKSISALHIALGGLPGKMRVEADPDIGVSATTVGELRKVTAWAGNLVITTPQEHHPESEVKISKASVTGSRLTETVGHCVKRLHGCSASPCPRWLLARADEVIE